MKDRLLWQKEVITKLQAYICTPGYIDYFEARGSSYLVLDYAEGESLGHHVRSILSGTEWGKISIENKERILGWFLEAVSLIETIHHHQIIHRDITDSNFILLGNGRLCIIDFELSYSLTDQRPDPPFLLGTFGYASPEQLQYFHPDEKDDIYSLGALLAFVLSGCSPHEFLDTTLPVVDKKLTRLTGSKLLTDLACKCLRPSRKDRPTLANIRETIDIYLDILIIRKHETFPMAV
jgi:serine/threonine protein kinase